MESLEDYICARFATAKIQTDPCPHVIIENILPSELYESIEKDIPDSVALVRLLNSRDFYETGTGGATTMAEKKMDTCARLHR